MEVIFMFSMFLLFVGISLIDVSGNQRWCSLLDRKGLTFLIFFMTLSGFAVRIHFSTFTGLYSGPEAVQEPLWGLKNIVMAIIPMTLISASYFCRDRNKSLLFVSVELGIWLFVYLFAKGSYSWGYYPMSYYKVYDYLALSFRFLLILNLLKVREHRFISAWFLAHVVITVKSNMFTSSCFGGSML